MHFFDFLGNEKIVFLLLKNQANKKIKNRKNQTPYDVAIQQNHSKIMDLLNRAGISAQSGKSFSLT